MLTIKGEVNTDIDKSGSINKIQQSRLKFLRNCNKNQHRLVYYTTMNTELVGTHPCKSGLESQFPESLPIGELNSYTVDTETQQFYSGP